jgi:beta-glucosidase-like glycosyl hydrolase
LDPIYQVVVGRELRALYNVGVAKGLDCWGPVVNLNRDPRWGRNGEGGAEDPFLMGEVAAGWTYGFQRGRGENETAGFLQGVLTLKHYVANSLENTKIERNVTADGQFYQEGTKVDRHNVDVRACTALVYTVLTSCVHQVRVSPYMLQQYLASFRAAAKAGARGMMCSVSGRHRVQPVQTVQTVF